MKKIMLLVLLICFSAFAAFGQENISIDINDEIYNVLEIAQAKGYCSILPGAKPYTKKQINKALSEILNNNENLSEKEISIVRHYQEKYRFDSDSKNNVFKVRLTNEKDKEGNNVDVKIPARFLYDFAAETTVSGGTYTNKKFNQWGIDVLPIFEFKGDISNDFSYMINATFDFCRAPLLKMGNYNIGYPWYEQNYETKPREIQKLINTAYLPYSYKKRWDGQMYLFKDLSAGGLEGWPQSGGVSGSITAELRGSFLDDRISIGGGRIRRELAAMDNGSSLVFNSKAQPFFAVDTQITLFPFIKYYSLTGSLEYPNQEYILNCTDPEGNVYGSWFPNTNTDDAYYWQNLFSINMIELDFKYLHFDFGSSVIWPKRLDIGYLFPLANYVEYQNHIGDYDNLAMFSDVKVRYPGIGEAWGSIYLEELNGLNNNIFTSTRDMYAIQGGLKYVIPGLDFATLALRYTKVEPFCYTHHSINYTPWYDHYISENYTSNGQCIGYYLDPNSDELKVSFEWKPSSNTFMLGNYQMIRHGADYGSQSVPGSSLYSEMSPYIRSDLKKYFLHDGAYNWMHIWSVSGNIRFNNDFAPFELYGSVGAVYSYYTKISDANYTSDGKSENCDYSTKYYYVNDNEYPLMVGGVLTLGVKVIF